MATDFTTAQGLRDVLLDMSVNRPEKFMSTVQQFTLRENDVNFFRGFYAQRPLFAPPADIAAIENVRQSGQDVTIHLYGRKAPGTGAQRKREGTDGQSVFNFTPSYFAPIVEDFEISNVNNAVRQFMNEGADPSTAIRMAMQDEMLFAMSQAVKNIYVRGDRQFRDFLEANKWALNTAADAGDRFTTYLGDAKRISNTDQTRFFQDLQIELNQNNFLSMNTARPQIYHSSSGMSVVNNYLKSGPQNNENLSQFLGYWDSYPTNEITPGTGVDSTYYVVAPGGVVGYSRAYDYAANDPENNGGSVTYGEDTWSTMTVGGEDTMMFAGLPQIKLELKQKKGFADRFSTLSIDEARIDIVKSWVLTATLGASKAPIQAGQDSPIIKHEILQP